MNKRPFSLIAAGLIILAGIAFCPTASAVLIDLTADNGGNYDVSAIEYPVKIAGKTVNAMVYQDDNNPLPAQGVGQAYANGIPILVMHLTVGQMVTCKFTNKLPNADVPEGASIHWHGLELDNDSDGTAVTQDSVLQNQSYTYRFIAPRPGLFWFHSHMVPGDTLFAGMYAVIIVTSPCETQLLATNGLPNAASTYTLAMSDIEFLTAPFTNTAGMTGAVYQAGSVGRVSSGQFQTINKWIHDCANNGAGQGPCGAAANPGKTVLCNGFNPDVDKAAVTYNVQSGQMIRLHLLNEALTRSFYLKMDPTNTQQLIRIGGQGGLLNNARLEGGNPNDWGWNTLYDQGAILLSSGMRADVVVTIPAGLTNQTLTLWGEPLNAANTQWPLMASVTAPYPIAYFNITGPFAGTNPNITNGSPIMAGTSCMVTNLTNGSPTILTNFITPAPNNGSANGNVRLTQQGGPVPSIDGLNLSAPAQYPNGNPLDGNTGNGSVWQTVYLPTSRYAHIGDLLHLTVQNQTGGMSGLAHPFHLHGFSMQPVAMIDGNGTHNFNYNEFLDTIDVYSGQTYVYNVLLEDRPRFCDQSSGNPPTTGPVLGPCITATNGGALGRWLFHCHIAAHGVLGMMGEVVVIDDTPQQTVWNQPPDASPTGVDVQATAATGSQTVADDFQTNGPITTVVIWGSWTNDVVDPNAAFELKFWTDVPAFNNVPSRPGWQAWREMFPAGTYTNLVYASNILYEAFWDPSNPSPGALGKDTKVYEYIFHIPQVQAFTPQPGGTNWVSVTAYTAVNTAFFGWKSSVFGTGWGDDGSWSSSTWGPPWTDLHYPPTHPFNPASMDMAFQLGVPVVQQGRPNVTVPTQPILSVSLVDGSVNISWTGGGILQYADSPTGSWTDIYAPNPYVVPAGGMHGYYRVRLPNQ